MREVIKLMLPGMLRYINAARAAQQSPSAECKSGADETRAWQRRWQHQCQRACAINSPPPVDAHVGRSSEPRVEDVNAADAVRTQQRVLEGRVVVEPQALPEPVDRINDHYSNG